MATITALDTTAYRIALPTALTDSTHGTMLHFELITARVRDADEQEGSVTRSPSAATDEPCTACCRTKSLS